MLAAMSSGVMFLGRSDSEWGRPIPLVRGWLAYSSFISQKHKFVYLETPKVASTKLKRLLYELEGVPIPGLSPRLRETKRKMYIHDRIPTGIQSLASLPEDEALEILNDSAYFKFCVVRDPYSRLVSVWRNKINPCEPGYESIYLELKAGGSQDPTFGDFCTYLDDKMRNHLRNADHHWALQRYLVFPHVLPYNHIGRLATIEETVRLWLDHTGISQSKRDKLMSLIPQTANESPPGRWQDFYDEKSAAIVKRLYREDFETFGFEAQLDHGSASLESPEVRQLRKWFEDDARARNEVLRDLYNAWAKALNG
jgi:hypothetical protein